MRNDVRALLLKKIYEKGRLFNDEEAFDFYVEYIMRNGGGCKWSPYKKYDRKQGAFKGGYMSLSLYELEQRASMWHKTAIGSLVLGNDLYVSTPNKPLENQRAKTTRVST